MPSGSFLLKQKITKIIVRTEPEKKISDDLSHIVRRYQEAGIKIKAAFGDNEISDITVPKPSRFKSLFYRFKVTMGLSRNAAGGFGSKIPDLQDSGYHGVG